MRCPNDKISFSILPNPRQTQSCCSIPPFPCLSCLIRNSLFNPNNFHRYVSLIKGGQTLLRENVKSSIKIRNGKKLLSLCTIKDCEIKGSYLWEQLPFFLSLFLREKYERFLAQCWHKDIITLLYSRIRIFLRLCPLQNIHWKFLQ